MDTLEIVSVFLFPEAGRPTGLVASASGPAVLQELPPAVFETVRIFKVTRFLARRSKQRWEFQARVMDAE